MHVWGFSVDLDSVAPFLFTALLVVYGLIYVVKNTASKYFVVDASFEGGAESAGNTNEPGMVRVDPEMTPDKICVVCGEIGTKRCSLCKAFRYCTTKCQAAHWNSGHKKNCKKVAVSNGDQNSIAHKQLKKILFSYVEFVKLYNWSYPGFPPCGLLNCGNSCFANVVLQCLTYTKPLVAYLLEKGHKRECKKAEWCFLCEFQTHVERASRSSQAFSPVNILSRLPHIGGNLGFGNQEDAHEFMRFAIDSMQSVFLDQFGGEKAINPSSQETTLIQYIFGGHLLSQVKCTSCTKVSNRYESMMDLTVEIHGDNASLEECLDQFTTPEWLDGDNMYKCDGCNAYVMAQKRLSIQQPPNILTIALKRFQSGRFGKLNKRVTFPEILDISPYMTNAVDGTDVYNLYAVVVHIDMLNASYFGHYICYIKDFRGGWYRVDDCKVARADLDEVLSSAAYMLLYCRNRPRALSQMPSEPLKGPESVEKLESCSTVFQSVATSASVSARTSWGVHAPVVPFSGCDNGDSETNDEATSKYVSREHENGLTHSLSPSKGTVVHDNGHSYQGSCLEAFQQTSLNIHERSESGCSSSTDKDLLTNGNGHPNQGSAASPVLGKRHRNSSFENDFNGQSTSSHFQGHPEDDLNGVSDPMDICDRVGIGKMEISDEIGDHTLTNGKFPSCHGEEHSVKRPAQNDYTIGADSGHSDVCNNSDDSRQKNNKSSQGLFKRGFLNQNGTKLKNKMNKNCYYPPSDESMFKTSKNCSSSVVDAACSADTSPKEKLCSDVEEMLCADVKGHMNMSMSPGKISDEGGATLPCKDDGSLHAGSDKLPCNGNYFFADSPEIMRNIQIDAEATPCTGNTKYKLNNCNPEGLTDTDYVNGSPSNTSSSAGKFCPDVGINGVSVSPSNTSSSEGMFSPDVENNGTLVSPSNTSSSGGKFCPIVSGPSASPTSTSSSSGGRFCQDKEISGGTSVSSFCCNDAKSSDPSIKVIPKHN